MALTCRLENLFSGPKIKRQKKNILVKSTNLFCTYQPICLCTFKRDKVVNKLYFMSLRSVMLLAQVGRSVICTKSTRGLPLRSHRAITRDTFCRARMSGQKPISSELRQNHRHQSHVEFVQFRTSGAITSQLNEKKYKQP